jgi:hypothetical protein
MRFWWKWIMVSTILLLLAGVYFYFLNPLDNKKRAVTVVKRKAQKVGISQKTTDYTYISKAIESLSVISKHPINAELNQDLAGWQ